jgi:predicted KAP-like P-loop ATPase
MCLVLNEVAVLTGKALINTFNNISVISWRSILLVEETGVPRENHQSNNVVLSTHDWVSSDVYLILHLIQFSSFLIAVRLSVNPHHLIN